LYRRGQALLGQRQWQAAAADLQRAAQLSASDPTQLRLIREKLQEAKDHISALRSSGELIEDEVATSTAVAAIATAAVSQDHASSSSSEARGRHDSGGAGGAPPVMDPVMLKAAADMMRSNPDWAKTVRGGRAGQAA
jgi:hypothetical protein